MNTRLLRLFADRVARRLVLVPGVGLVPLAAVGCGPGAQPNAHTEPDVPPMPARDPDADAIEAFGPEFVTRVKQSGGRVSVFAGSVTLGGKAVTDADLAKLAPLKDKDTLRDLDLSDAAVTADGVAKLKGYDLHSLKLPAALRTDAGLPNYLAAVRVGDTLDLSGWAITDAGLKSLAGIEVARGEWDTFGDWVPGEPARGPLLAQLTRLDLGDTAITDDGVTWLVKTLTEFQPPAKLRSLDLSHTKVGDVGVTALAGLTGLESLTIDGTQVTDAGLKALPPGLVELDVSDTKVTDEGITHVNRLTKLSTLSVSGTHVTDNGLNALVGLAALRYVMVAGSRVTPAGTARFSTGHPDAHVDSSARSRTQRQTALSVVRGGFGTTAHGTTGS